MLLATITENSDINAQENKFSDKKWNRFIKNAIDAIPPIYRKFYRDENPRLYVSLMDRNVKNPKWDVIRKNYVMYKTFRSSQTNNISHIVVEWRNMEEDGAFVSRDYDMPMSEFVGAIQHVCAYCIKHGKPDVVVSCQNIDVIAACKIKFHTEGDIADIKKAVMCANLDTSTGFASGLGRKILVEDEPCVNTKHSMIISIKLLNFDIDPMKQERDISYFIEKTGVWANQFRKVFKQKGLDVKVHSSVYIGKAIDRRIVDIDEVVKRVTLFSNNLLKVRPMYDGCSILIEKREIEEEEKHD